MKLIGIESTRDGRGFVLTDSEQDTHEVHSPEALWRAFVAIMGNKALPHADVAVIPDHVRVEAKIDELGDQVEHDATVLYGPLVGRIVGTLGKDVAKNAHRIFRGARRRGRSPR